MNVESAGARREDDARADRPPWLKDPVLGVGRVQLLDTGVASVGTAGLLRVEGVRKSFDCHRDALARTDLAIATGEVVGLIGPSGCGKTTLLKLMAGLLQPSSGRVAYQGAADRLAYVFQDATLLPWLTTRDNVALPLRIAGVPRKTALAIVEQKLELVGLSSAATLYPRELSGGMKMRASIARALTRDPELLLLDEPFGALDEMSRDHLNEELLRLREQSKWTAVFVTHSVAEAVFLASRIVVLSPSPGRVHSIVPVPLPYPRVAATRGLPEYAALVLEVTRALHAVQGVGAELLSSR